MPDVVKYDCGIFSNSASPIASTSPCSSKLNINGKEPEGLVLPSPPWPSQGTIVDWVTR